MKTFNVRNINSKKPSVNFVFSFINYTDISFFDIDIIRVSISRYDIYVNEPIPITENISLCITNYYYVGSARRVLKFENRLDLWSHRAIPVRWARGQDTRTRL